MSARRFAAFALLVATLATSGACYRKDVIGPYVRSINRDGPMLMVEYCEIVLDGNHLNVGACNFQQFPIAQLPTMPGQPMPMQAPPPPAPAAAGQR